MYGLVMFALFRMYDPIRKLSRIHVQIQRAFASSTRIVELLDTHREIQDKPGARSMDGFNDSVEFQNVCFDYSDQNGETRVLKRHQPQAKPKPGHCDCGQQRIGEDNAGGIDPALL